MITTVIQDR